MKHGILVLNFGGPSKLEEVKPFLYRLFCDPSILQGVPTPFRQLLAWLITLIKGPSSVECYRLIGGGSPQLKWTKVQAEGLAARLLPRASETRVVVGMRSWAPFIEQAVEELRQWGADEITLLPLFPQFSTTTTGSCLAEARRCLAKAAAQGFKPLVREVASFPDDERYVRLLKDTIAEATAAIHRASGNEDKPYLLFSAHGLPLKVVKRGDPYPQEVGLTVTRAAEGLGLRWSLAYQSRNGPLPWLQPYIETEIERLGREGVRKLVVCPISFVSDHIETLYELDILYAELARRSGIEFYTRTRSFNDDQGFVALLEDLVQRTSVAATPRESQA